MVVDGDRPTVTEDMRDEPELRHMLSIALLYLRRFMSQGLRAGARGTRSGVRGT